MTNNEEKLVEIIEVLCDAVSDTPCGCEACPYNTQSEECEVGELIEELRGKENEV